MAEKKPTPSKGVAKRYGTLIRVTDDFAELMREASSFEKMSVAEYANTYLMPVVQKRHKEAVVSKAKKMEGKA
jgi:hypothetical protein